MARPLSRFLAPALLIGLAGPAAALDLADMTAGEREAFGAAVRAYLLENPEVLMEVVAALEARQAAAQSATDLGLVQANLAALLDDGHSWVGGNPEGDVTLIEFFDYRCGYCRQAFAETEALVADDGNIRFILKEFPILGAQSLMAAQFAVAVQQLHGADSYKAVHDALMQLRSDVTAESLSRLADSFGLDPAPILARMEGPEVRAVLEANHQLAQAMQITGTPTFVIGSRMVRGYLPYDRMAALVAAERAD